jgi:transcriptional regulator with XRE-family HTH domain
MLEITITPRADGFMVVSAAVPADRVDNVERAIEEALEPDIPAEEVFADLGPGDTLRGMRGLREMTQAQLAASSGVSKSQLSRMERGTRPIGKEMAKKLGRTLGMNWRIFVLDDRMYGTADTFPDMGPGNILRGMRRREDLTQEQLAVMVDVTKADISAMETGKRPIGEAMAERLAKALNTSYKVFL